MIIFNSIGEKVIEVEADSNSYSHEAIMGENVLVLNFLATSYTEIPIYSYCEFNGTIYTLARPENLKRHGKNNLEVSLKLEGPPFQLAKYKVRNIVSRRLKFSLTAKPSEFLQLIVDNLNMRESGWSAGSCIDAAEKHLTFNHTYTDEGLKNIAEEFKTEYEVVGKTISLRKVEYNKESPLELSYGRGNGFLPGCGRFNFENNIPIEILFVEGGEKNIDGSKYGSPQLLLPKSQSIVYEGRTYYTDSDGLSVYRGDQPLHTRHEGSLDCTHIYPKRVGEVTSVENSGSLYDIIDATIPEALNFSLCGIAGEKVSIIFQTGMLAGREFDIEADSNGNLTGYIHEERRFKIVSREMDGEEMPSPTFAPAAGDKYAIFGIQLPEAYICDNITQSGASWDMLREAAKHLYENEDPQYSFTGDLDGIWSKSRWLAIGGKIKLGGYISFTDLDFQTVPALIRIVDIVRYINEPESPKIKLSNITVGGNVRSELRKIKEGELLAKDRQSESISYTKRRYRDARETIATLESALLDFDGKINPVAIQTMSLLVGDESLQFRFVDNTFAPIEVSPYLTYNKISKRFTASAGIIQHMTLGISSTAPSHPLEDYKFWDIDSYESPALEIKAEKYFLYARVEADGSSGTFTLSKTAIGMAEETGYFHLLVGLLNSEYYRDRGFTTLYGFTEILPGRIITERIQDKDAKLVIDLANAIIEAKEGAEIKGKLSIGAGSSGMDKFSEYESLVTSIELARLFIQYSGDGISWHETFIPGDNFMRQRNGIAGEWSSAIRIVGIPGGEGAAGSYYELEYAIGGTSAPELGWQSDAPTPTAAKPYVWLRTRLVSPSDNFYGSWTYTKLSGTEGVDGKGVEFIFVRTASDAPPALPVGQDIDDFVPAGWTDDQQGVSAELKYEWSSKRTKVGGAWGTYSQPALWARFASDGLPGSDADAQAARDDIARGLGYASYSSMLNAIATNKTIIENGHIRTSLLEAFSILTSNLSTAAHGKRITISKEANAVLMYDDSGEIRARISGDELGNPGVSGSTFSCTNKSGSISRHTVGESTGTYAYSGSNVLAVISPSGANNSVSIPSVELRVEVSNLNFNDNVNIVGRIYAGSTLIGSALFDSATHGAQETLIIPAASINLPVGITYLTVEFEYSLFVEPGNPGYEVQLYTTFAQASGSINYSYALTEFASNGFRTMWASNIYFIASNTIIEAMFGNYGFRISTTGFEKTTNGGSSWVTATL